MLGVRWDCRWFPQLHWSRAAFLLGPLAQHLERYRRADGEHQRLYSVVLLAVKRALRVGAVPLLPLLLNHAAVEH